MAYLLTENFKPRDLKDINHIDIITTEITKQSNALRII